MPAAPGISRGGVDSETMFLRLTGATRAEKASLGDAVLDGRYVEVKHATSATLNQVRAVKYITLVVFFAPTGQWYVVPANEIVRQCASKKRGQHTENPFESATLSMRNLGPYVVADLKQLKRSVLDAVAEAERYPDLKDAMGRVLDESRALAETSVSEVRHVLDAYGLA